MKAQRGTTALELMIVVLIIGVLAAIAVPNFLQARENSRRKTCIANLRGMDQGKEQWAMENKAAEGAAVTITQLVNGKFLRGPLTGPQCPAGGTYALMPVGKSPTCTVGDHFAP